MNDALLHSLGFALRGGLVALMLFAAALVWRDHGRSPAGRLAAALAIGIAAYAVQSAPEFLSLPPLARVPLAVLSTGNAVVFWLFSRALFDDDFRWQPVHGAAWGAMALIATLGCYARSTVILPITLATAGFALLALVSSLSSWRVDLVEKRRRARVFIVCAGALYTVANMAARLFQGAGSGPAAGVVDIGVLMAIAVPVAWHLVRPSAAQLLGLPLPQPSAPGSPAPMAAADAPSDAQADTQPDAQPGTQPPELVDTALIDALQRLMSAERAYRQDGLTIGALAGQLGVPEYKLRRTINQGMGYRNFNAFLNRYRIAEVKAALVDPEQAPVPVLTLALEAGFQSIGPFNRAFKAETGLTPTEFRRTPPG